MLRWFVSSLFMFVYIDDYPVDEEELNEMGVKMSEDPLFDKDSDAKDAKWVADHYSTNIIIIIISCKKNIFDPFVLIFFDVPFCT